MIKLKILISVFIVALFTAFISCDSNSDPDPVVSETIADLNADYAPYESPLPTDRPPSRVGATNKYTLFSFKTGTIVSQADSATVNWDIAFRSTSIIINGGTSGPGSVTAQIVSGTLESITEAPIDGYKSDNKNGTTAEERNAIPAGSGKGWYTYSPGSNLVSPIAGKVIIVKTADNRYVKFEILSYYKGAPATVSPEPAGTDKDRYYTFRYVYQPNDTRIF
ncbi:MAG: HmuY family protein [Cyclobacteriaceae bacterium]|nr:HmuY family protein [Cyclobacteriaceae bacterium]